MLDDATPSGDERNPGPLFLIPSSFQRHPRALDNFRILPARTVVRYTALFPARVAYLCCKLYVATTGSCCRSLEVKCSVRSGRLPKGEGSPAATLDEALSTPPAYVEMFHVWP